MGLRRAVAGALAAALLPLAASAQTEAACRSWLATQPSPAGLPALPGPGAAQRAALLAAGGKIVSLDNRYYTVSIPAAFYTASAPVLVFDLHGTGGYPEAEWSDWGAAMAAKGHAFVGLAWGGGTPGATSDADIHRQLQQIAQDLGRVCPVAGASKWLMGFSVGSAVSFAVMVRDAAGARLLRGNLAVSGAAIGPLTSGRDVMHATVEAARDNPAAMLDVLSWQYCGDLDVDHGWSLCTEMPNAEAFVNQHGGSARLYRDATGDHHSLPGNPAAREDMFAYIAAAPKSLFLSDSELSCLFGWGEARFPTLFAPAGGALLQSGAYRYRHYAQSQAYLGVSSADGRLYWLPAGYPLQDLGPAGALAEQALCR